MSDHENVLQAIYRAVDYVNGELAHDAQVVKALDTRLYGPGSVLDSLGLVNLVVAIERELEDEFGCAITLVNEQALSMKNSPFRTIRTISEYAEMMVSGALNG